MQSLKKNLQNLLKDSPRVVVLGVGSDLRGDDFAGMLVAEKVERGVKKSKRIKVIFGATAPESLTGEIRKFNPTYLLIIDAAEMGKKPGEVMLFDPRRATGGTSFSTHRLPPIILADYCHQSFGCESLIIGIQPQHISFGKPPSAAIRSTATKLAKVILETLKKTGTKPKGNDV